MFSFLNRKSDRRRIVIGILILVTASGAVWWSFPCLNETEKKFVGAWESQQLPGTAALFLLPDRRVYGLNKIEDRWICNVETSARWRASPKAFVRRVPVDFPADLSIEKWRDYLTHRWNGFDSKVMETILVTNDEIRLNAGTFEMTLHRSQDSELISVFERMSSGSSVW